MAVFLRITRHEADEARVAFIRGKFGAETVITERDIPFGENPVQAVAQAIAETGDKVVAVEVIAPLPVLARLLEARREISVPLVRAEFQRDPATGRAVVVGKDHSGRDILAFDRYTRLVRVSVETEEL